MKRRVSVVAATATAFTLMATGLVLAHPERGERAAEELFPGEGVLTDHRHQHGGVDGHLDPRQENVALIGKAALSAPEGVQPDMTGRVADVAAFGNFAYLTAFTSPDCLGGGAWIVDMSDPTNPVEVGFLPTTQGNYAGEGAQVIDVEHGPFAGRQLFIHQNEILASCVPVAAATGKDVFRGGINIWDVTDPHDPVLLAEHVGDTDIIPPNVNSSHSMFAWNSHLDEKVYVVLVDNFEFEDVDIMDITDPANAVMVNELDLFSQFGIGADNPPHLQSIFNHDMMVYRKGNRYIMNVNYWDGGYVLLDVTDPTPGNVSLIANWEFPEFDDQRLQHGEMIPPEGNAHQSELSPNFKFMIGTDEDFSPFGFEFTSSAFEGDLTAVEAAFTPPVAALPGQELSGEVVHVGRGCPAATDPNDGPAVDDPYLADPAGKIALIQRGACRFDFKVARAQLAGAIGVIVYGLDGDEALILMGGENPIVSGTTALTGTEITIPAVFVPNSTGVLLRDGEPPVTVSIKAEFTGWGYVRLFSTHIPGAVGSTGSITQIDTYAIPEAQDPAFGIGFGDLTVHEVAMDPRPGTNLAYFSYYAGGFRVAEYGNKGITEVGSFIDEGGNDFWGVEVHKHPDGAYYVLASDRDFGLYIFQYTGKIPGGDRGNSVFNDRP